MVYYFINNFIFSNFQSVIPLHLIYTHQLSKLLLRKKSTNLYLMKKLDMNKDEVNDEFDDFIKGEVTKRVDKKIKTF